MNATEKKLRNLLAYFENAASSLRAALALLDSNPIGRARNGHGNGIPDVMSNALALDEQRRGARVGKRGPAPRGKGHTASKLEKRANTSRILARFSTDEPRPRDAGGAGSAVAITTLTRWGYLKPKGGGLVRTSKPFAIDWREEGAGK